MQPVPFLDDLADVVRLNLTRGCERHCLMRIRVELVTNLGADLKYRKALERGIQLPEGQFQPLNHPLHHALGPLKIDGPRKIQAIANIQQLACKTFQGKSPGIADLGLGPFSSVLSIRMSSSLSTRPCQRVSKPGWQPAGRVSVPSLIG